MVENWDRADLVVHKKGNPAPHLDANLDDVAIYEITYRHEEFVGNVSTLKLSNTVTFEVTPKEIKTELRSKERITKPFDNGFEVYADGSTSPSASLQLMVSEDQDLGISGLPSISDIKASFESIEIRNPFYSSGDVGHGIQINGEFNYTAVSAPAFSMSNNFKFVLEGDITQKPLAASDFDKSELRVTKVYNASTIDNASAKISGEAYVIGDGKVRAVLGDVASFSGHQVSDRITASVMVTGIEGEGAANYKLVAPITLTDVAASITKAEFTFPLPSTPKVFEVKKGGLFPENDITNYLNQWKLSGVNGETYTINPTYHWDAGATQGEIITGLSKIEKPKGEYNIYVKLMPKTPHTNDYNDLVLSQPLKLRVVEESGSTQPDNGSQGGGSSQGGNSGQSGKVVHHKAVVLRRAERRRVEQPKRVHLLELQPFSQQQKKYE